MSLREIAEGTLESCVTLNADWPARYLVPDGMRDCCMFEAASRRIGFGEWCRWPVTERCVWALCVVVDAPFLNDHLGLLEAVEDFAIQTLIPEFSVEGLTIAILPR